MPKYVEINPEKSLVLDTKGAAEMLGLSPGTLENMRYTHGRYSGPPYAMLGRKVVYPISGLEDYLASRMVRG